MTARPSPVRGQPVRLIGRHSEVIATGSLVVAGDDIPKVITFDCDSYLIAGADGSGDNALLIYQRTDVWHGDGTLQPCKVPA